MAALIAAAGALVGYGVLRQKVASLETWRVLQEAQDRGRDKDIQGLLEVAATTTANVKSLSDSVKQLVEMRMRRGVGKEGR